MDLVKGFVENAKKSPNRPAIFFMGNEITYGELDAASNALAHKLRSMGIEAGKHVGLLLFNTPNNPIAYFAVVKLGGTIVPMNFLFKPYELSYLFDHSDIEVLIYEPQLEELVKATLQESKNQPKLLRSDEFQSIIASESKAPVLVEREPDDVASILYTSGTTGRPKGAMLTHKNLTSNVEAVIEGVKATPDDVFTLVLPLFHSFGITVGMLSPLTLGAKVALLPRFMPDSLLQTIEAAGGTIFMGVPSMFAVLADVPDPKKYDLSSWKFCISGGAPLPIPVMEAFESKYGVLIYEGDGPTECSPVTAVNPIGGKRKPGSIGLPVKYVEMKIADDEGNFLPPETIGEIVVKGPNVMKGYYKDPEATKAAFFGEYFRTGDVGKVDEEGYFYILDRKKDVIIVDGLNVYPREIEELLYAHPAIKEAAIIGVPHRLHGEIPRAYIVLNEGQSLTQRELIDYLRPKLAQFKLPRQVVFVEELPKTATGKIAKHVLREQVRKEARS